VQRAEAALSCSLGVRVHLARVTEPLSPSVLSPGEAVQCCARRPGQPRRDWLLGRAALRAVIGDGDDTSDLSFPSPTLSLTHAGGIAVAVRTDEVVGGIGVDFEPRRPGTDPRIARFFLNETERAAATGPAALLRLWTIKEALYKATPDNGSYVLADLELADPCEAHGDAVGRRGETLRYAAIDALGGHLAVAVCGGA